MGAAVGLGHCSQLIISAPCPSKSSQLSAARKSGFLPREPNCVWKKLKRKAEAYSKLHYERWSHQELSVEMSATSWYVCFLFYMLGICDGLSAIILAAKELRSNNVRRKVPLNR